MFYGGIIYLRPEPKKIAAENVFNTWTKRAVLHKNREFRKRSSPDNRSIYIKYEERILGCWIFAGIKERFRPHQIPHDGLIMIWVLIGVSAILYRVHIRINHEILCIHFTTWFLLRFREKCVECYFSRLRPLSRPFPFLGTTQVDLSIRNWKSRGFL